MEIATVYSVVAYASAPDEERCWTGTDYRLYGAAIVRMRERFPGCAVRGTISHIWPPLDASLDAALSAGRHGATLS